MKIPIPILSQRMSACLLLSILLAFFGCQSQTQPEDMVPRAECGPGSRPETALQGQIPHKDRISGRSTEGYSCNMKRVSHYQGTGNATIGASYSYCMYAGSFSFALLKGIENPGVQVVSFADLDNPVLTDVINSPAMRLGTWETLKVHEERGLLIGAAVPLVFGGGFLSIYDVKTDCGHPRLLNGIDNDSNTAVMPFRAHEGAFSPDGMTYWASGLVPGTIHAIDITDPSKPEVIFGGLTGLDNHGFSFSPDGKRLYISNQFPAGVNIMDVSEIQERKENPVMRAISALRWTDGLITQIPIPFRSQGKDYLIAVDEGGSGGVRLIDINDVNKPFVARKYELEINRPEYRVERTKETDKSGVFGYEGHYCTLQRFDNPQYLACSYTQSGIRVFDISEPMQAKEVAYYMPPTEPGAHTRLLNSAHAQSPFATNYVDIANGNLLGLNITLGPPDMTADWCMSQPRFVDNQIWVHCDDAGAMVLEFSNGVGPKASGTQAQEAAQ